MEQLTQQLRSGKMAVQDVPYPQLNKGFIIVKNHFSVISSGTEGSTVKSARMNLIEKAKERPQQVKQVIDSLKNLGPIQTYRAVTKKLDSYSPLGYSCAGEVIEVAADVSGFKPGDFVACAGAGYANHAEIVSIPVNLAVKLDKNADLKDASYNTLGAIAMQGVRQADLRIGESCAVVGLGLLGHLTSLILKASGVKVIGIDVSMDAIEFAKKNNCCDFVYARDNNGITNNIMDKTSGIGVDAVIIAAGTNSNDPINFAGEICRKKGTVVILGDVPTGFKRNPYWYPKELELKMACSYGPGRYDINYEEKGIDYPISYVRWTENRNMIAFQDLIFTKKIDIGYLSTHLFDFENAPKAYDLIIDKKESFLGIVLKYNSSKKTIKSKIKTKSKKSPKGSLKISFIGAGSYAQSNLLPNLKNLKDISLVGVLTNSGTTSKRVAEKYNFQFATPSIEDILDKNSDTIFIATRHDSHADFVIKSIESGKNIFVEKPICLNKKELEEIIRKKEKSNSELMIGFNRRFSPLTKKIKNTLKTNMPVSMIYRVNAGFIPKDSWIQDLEIGGGRIIGEVCHFIDYLTYINGSLPEKISANALKDVDNLNDTINISIQFQNGSIGVICYYANGSKKLPKEYIEIYSSGTSFVLTDFKELKIYGSNAITTKRLLNQNKGQLEMVSEFINSLIKSGESVIKFDEIISVTKSSFKLLESIKNKGKLMDINE